ncbi:hypothetical protein ANN_13056 [Periplaneta americana]|uniref:DUF4817 domain-containing protein n=1 Tax=Periplaneta americana TaxID=6978 RepID=A0ABQ8TKJ5_PERAM|nr:hypothetical protein ANN_13056 [Periplaneta americana]
MAGLCEGGNEPSGSVKAICKYTTHDVYGCQSSVVLCKLMHKMNGAPHKWHILMAFILHFVVVIDWSLPSKETLRGHPDSSFRGEGYIQCCVGVRLCDMYSNQELAEIHFMYGKADSNAALACRLYQERYPQRQCPDRKTFVRLHYRVCEYGKFNSPGLGRGRPRSTTPEVQEEILEAVNMTPISTRRVALKSIVKINKKIEELQEENMMLKRNVKDLEEEKWKNNLVFFGIEEQEREQSWETYEKLILQDCDVFYFYSRSGYFKNICIDSNSAPETENRKQSERCSATNRWTSGSIVTFSSTRSAFTIIVLQQIQIQL